MKTNVFVLFIVIAFLTSCQKTIDSPIVNSNENFSFVNNSKNTWGTYRGVNVSAYIKETDLEYLSKMNVNIIRLSFGALPLVNKQKPFNYNSDAFQRLDNILKWSKKYGLKVVIDPHTTPGTASNFTTTYRDALWNDTVWQTPLIDLWNKISQLYKNEDVIAGYDLLNEPAFSFGLPDSGPGSWNELSAKLINVIRKNGDNHTIILETPAGEISKGKWLNRINSISTIKVPADKNIVISFHMYEPQSFTHQGVNGMPVGVHFPGTIDNEYWDESKLEQTLQPVVEFQKKWNVPIFVGEFSASRYAGPDGNKYVEALIKIFEKYNWNWAYHTFRSEPPNSNTISPWNPEASVTDLKTNERFPNSPRMQILEKYFLSN